jgi:hypothetical protein
MTKFLVQIVLHNGQTPAIFKELNEEMGLRGFSRELPGKKAAYHLPAGTYWYEGNTSPNNLRLKASEAAETVGQEFGIIVVRINGWSIMRLKKVEVAPQA